MFNSRCATIAKYVYHLCLLALVGGCAGPQLTMRAVEYNEAVSESSNELLLLNTVRAAKRFPIYYSVMGTAKGQPVVQGKTTLSLPLGPNLSKGPFPFGNEVNYNAGFSTFDITNTNSMDLKASAPLSPDEYNFFLDSDWARELVDMMTIQRIELNAQAVSIINGKVDKACRPPLDLSDRKGALCQLILARTPGCAHDRTLTRYFNSGKDSCDYSSFQRFVRKVRLLGLRIKQEPQPPSRPADKAAPKKETGRAFIMSAPGAKEMGLGKPLVQFRSPEGMIVYLGQVVAAQNFTTPAFTPTIIVSTSTRGRGGPVYTRARLFHVKRSLADGEVAVVSARHEGDAFYIPRPNYGADDEDRSLQALALINTLIRTRLEGAATRPVATIAQ